MMPEVLNLSDEKTIIKVLQIKKPTAVKKTSIPLVHVSDSMDKLRQLSIIIVKLIKFSS